MLCDALLMVLAGLWELQKMKELIETILDTSNKPDSGGWDVSKEQSQPFEHGSKGKSRIYRWKTETIVIVIVPES